MGEVGAFLSPSPINGTGNVRTFHPMKGPMTTQTLRGLVNHGAMHWRGDRSVGFFGTGAFDSDLSFRNFIVAFQGLLGRGALVSDTDMQKFADFGLQITLPPNPNRALDNSLTPAQQRGKDFFLGLIGPDSGGGHRADGLLDVQGLGFTCESCHRLDPAKGFFGTDGKASFEAETQIIKIPHLRNLYQKVGMFGMPAADFFNPGNNAAMGDQIRGFGFIHDGSVDTLFRFLRALVFNSASGGTLGLDGADPERREVEQFLLAFDSDLAPVVGQQVTLDSTNAAVVGARIDLLIERAGTPFTSLVLGPGATECDLIAKAAIGGTVKGFVRQPNGLFQPDDGGPALTDAQLRAVASRPGREVTYTCVPPGSGQRLGVNRDADPFLDALDNCPAVANDNQADTDADGVGDLCDDRCAGLAATTLVAGASEGRPGSVIAFRGTGFGPQATVWFGRDAAPRVTVITDTSLTAQVPPVGPRDIAVRVVNPEGCRSLDTVSFTVLASPGDCDLDGQVTVDELITGVTIALQEQPLAVCATLDTDSDGKVTVAELVVAVNAALGVVAT
ncbi:MAG: IPT/TIG domain-containing protein [Candidatus Binatia bacterium]